MPFGVTEIISRHKGPLTPRCVSTACSYRCKIPGIAVGSQLFFLKQYLILFEILTSEDVTASWRRRRCFYLAIDCVLAEYPPSLEFLSCVHGVLCALTACTRRSLLIGMWILIQKLYTCMGNKQKILTLQLVNAWYNHCFCFF